ncbi:MAG: biotin/lipoyl-binding protein, partial [Burkholderiaceae bacterium]|nr:biotin/lipoyl-binding protein [Burkholderiaceae bacterium]
MLGKLVVHAATREEAISRLAAALDDLQVLGLPTNRALLAACLRHPVFVAGDALIPFLEQHGDAIRAQLIEAEHSVRMACGLAAVFGGDGRAASSLACAFPRPVRLRHRGELMDVAVSSADLARQAAGVVTARVDGRHWHAQHAATDVFIDGASFDPPASAGGAAAGQELRAPFNGKLIAVKVAAGDKVAQGDVLVIVESMKLEHSLAASRAGVVAGVAVEAGQQVAPGQVLVTLEAG